MYGGERRIGRDYYSGRLYERDYLGEARVTDEFREAWRKLRRNASGRLERLEDLYDLVKLAQDGDPTNPKKDFARELRLAVADELNVEEEGLEGLRFYTAVGTPLDNLGVDAFVECRAKNGLDYRVTLDITMNRDKVESGHRADVIVGELPDPEDDGYLEAVESYAKKIADVLRRRQESDERRRGLRAAS